MATMASHSATLDNREPLKVKLPASFEPNSGMANMATPERSHGQQLTSAHFTYAVGQMSQFLNDEGWRRAQTILDCAIGNERREQALESSFEVGGSSNLLCTMIQVQQQQLWTELHWLPFQPDFVRHRSVGPPGQAALPRPPGQVQAPVVPKTPAVAQASPSPAPGSPAAAPAKSPTNSIGPPPSSASAKRRGPQTLSTSLRILEDEEPDCLIIVRRISKLGFKASAKLKKYFSAHGTVVKVLLAHSTARQYCEDQQTGKGDFHVKRRPSNLGFVQMSSRESVDQLLLLGASQDIEGVSVCVSRFEKHGDSDQVEAELPAMPEDVVKPAPRMRGSSDVSTAASEETPKKLSSIGSHYNS